MRFTTKTEYGLICLIYMARHAGQTLDPVTIKQLVHAEHFPPAYTEKIFQRLRTAGIVASHHGQLGGYVLARSASLITLREVVEALEGHTFDVFCEPRIRSEITCNHFPLCGVKPVWNRTKELLDEFYGSISLDMLARNELRFEPVGSSPKPSSENHGT